MNRCGSDKLYSQALSSRAFAGSLQNVVQTELKRAIMNQIHATPLASVEPVNAELNWPLSSKRATFLTLDILNL